MSELRARISVGSGPRSRPNTVNYAIETDDMRLLTELVQSGINKSTSENVTLQKGEGSLGLKPIHIAAEFGRLEFVEYLISRGVALAIRNHVRIVKALLEAGVSVKPKDSAGDLPIHWAATEGNLEVITMLVRHESPVDDKNYDGWTAMHRAAHNNRRRAVQSLIQAGADIGVQNNEGNTPLHVAVHLNNIPCIENWTHTSSDGIVPHPNDVLPAPFSPPPTARDPHQGTANGTRPRSGASQGLGGLKMPLPLPPIGTFAGTRTPTGGQSHNAGASVNGVEGGEKLRRSVSGQKKFLAKYNLSNSNVFAPSS
eukprot:gene21565-28559_t